MRRTLKNNVEIQDFQARWAQSQQLDHQQWESLRGEGENLLTEQFFLSTVAWLEQILSITDDLFDWMFATQRYTITTEPDNDELKRMLCFRITPETLTEYEDCREIWIRDKTIPFLPGMQILGHRK